MQRLENWIEELLINSGMSAHTAIYLRLVILIVLLVLLAGVTVWISKKLILPYIYRLVKTTRYKWDDVLADRKMLDNLAHILPAIVIRALIPGIVRDFEQVAPFILRLTDVYLIIVGASIFITFIRIAEVSVERIPAFVDKPISSYFQLVRIIIYIIAFILILSVLLDKSPVYFLSAFGAISAVLLLVFKDTILGLVASVQMSSNDMVRVGDWVEMPKFNADGDVLAINLNTVKVQNWDKTITTIPTYYFITDSFKNWRGMVDSGGRRIKRSLLINSQTVKFIDPKTRDHFKKYQLITDYLNERQQEIEQFNQETGIDTSELINGRRMTNLGVFRKYIEHYLKNHPHINQHMTIMVRQLAIEEKGVPLEIYCFTKSTAWLVYESVQSDVFDHLLAAARYFDLGIFQQPSGNDISGPLDRLATLSQGRPAHN